jgi:ABC-2 type transport system permease protein
METITTLRRYARLYALYVKLYVQSGLVYQLETYVKLLTRFLEAGVSLAFIALLYTKVEAINGWGRWELYLLAGFGGVVVNLHHLFMYNVYNVGEGYVMEGDFDRFLVRPARPLFQLYADKIHDNYVINVLVNAGVFGYAALQVETLALTPLTVLYGLVMLVSGVFAIGALYLVAGTAAFWMGRVEGLFWMLGNAIDFRKYPTSIYSTAVRTILWTVLPVAATIFVPVNVLVGAPRWTLAQGVALFVGPLAYGFAYLIWKRGLRRYSSTGS